MSLLAAAILSCVPALPFYCQNIHVGCAGRSATRTEAFRVQSAKVVFEAENAWEVRTQTDRGATILWRKGHADWIRIEPDGRFSLRRYSRTPLMTRGTCRQVPEATR